jgi:hypothetical protein
MSSEYLEAHRRHALSQFSKVGLIAAQTHALSALHTHTTGIRAPLQPRLWSALLLKLPESLRTQLLRGAGNEE